MNKNFLIKDYYYYCKCGLESRSGMGQTRDKEQEMECLSSLGPDETQRLDHQVR